MLSSPNAFRAEAQRRRDENDTSRTFEESLAQNIKGISKSPRIVSYSNSILTIIIRPSAVASAVSEQSEVTSSDADWRFGCGPLV